MNAEHKFGMVALIGPPNAGKSTLMNAYLGQKLAIVTPKPQTTRNRISGILTRDDAQIVFLDTPGIHRLRGRMNRFLLDSAWSALNSCDVVVALFDAALYTAKPHLFEKEIEPLVEPLRGCRLPVLLALNKVDRVKDKAQLLPLMQRLSETFPECELLPLSAVSGEGRDALLERLLALLPEGPSMFPEDQISTVPLRFLAAEIIREKLFLSLREELPYSTAVEIELFEESEPTVRIAAAIYAAKSNHKGMIIGKGGQNLRNIGQQAREELEELLERKVMLELWVKVKEDWTEHPGFLRSLGLGE